VWECRNPRPSKFRHRIEEADLASRTLALRTRATRDRVVEGEQDLRWVAEAPERANLGQRFKDALVRKAQVNPLAELLERSRLLPRFTCGNDRLGGSSADILDP
jgi:hypothetical protein